MSTKYKFGDNEIPHFVSFAVIKWIDVLTRNDYKDIIVDSLDFCIQRKGMCLRAWVIMTNHVHLILNARRPHEISSILRDFKKFTSSQIIKAISDNPKESRSEWMLRMFANAGEKNGGNERFQFWQQNNHPIELVSNAMIGQRFNYLHENPVRAGIVYEPQDYVYSSGVDYYTERKGKLPLEYL